MRTDILGWFVALGDEKPFSDPGMGAPCPVCAKPVRDPKSTTVQPIKTISFMPVAVRKSFFFRVHKACWEGISEDEQGVIEGVFVDDIVAGEIRGKP